MKRPLLDRQNAVYELLADSVPDWAAGDAAEGTLTFIEGLAAIAWHAHPGKYADGKIENVLLQIGESLDSHLEPMASPTDWIPPDLSSKAGRRVLHVATEVHVVGGHTRLLTNWIRNDATSAHSVVLTAQSPRNAVPEWLHSSIAGADGRLIVLPPDAPRLCRAKWLRNIAQAFDLVVLHQHPSDVVPTVAFAIAGLPPVAVLNHADHVFWLGSAVSDMVINLRPAGKLLSETRRMVLRNALLPILLSGPP